MSSKSVAIAATAVFVGPVATFGTSVLAAHQGPHALITQPVDKTHLTQLYGNTRPEADARHDGAAGSTTRFRSITCCCN